MRINVSRMMQEMKRLGINDSELARRCGKSRAWPGQVKKTGVTTFDMVSRLADALGVPEHLLIKGGKDGRN